MKQIFKLVTGLFLILLFGCTHTDVEKIDNLGELNQQEDGLSTVPLENSLDFFEAINNKELGGSYRAVENLDLEINTESLRQVDVTDTEAKLNIADASTNFDNVRTQVLQIEIDEEVQTVLFHHVPENNADESSSSDFSGFVFSTDLSGIVLSGFSIDNGSILGSFNFLTSSYSTDPEPDCWGIACGITLNEVVLTAPREEAIDYISNTSNNYNIYQWNRSLNNYSSMGIAYANYYRNKAIREGGLPPSCKSFRFEGVGVNWQASLVQGIQFGVGTLLTNGNATIYRIRDYIDSPILFETWKNDRFGNSVSPGVAAELAASALNNAIRGTAHNFKDKYGFSETQVRIWFEDKLKSEFSQLTDGGRITFRNNRYNQNPTDYKTTLFGSDNCDNQ